MTLVATDGRPALLLDQENLSPRKFSFFTNRDSASHNDYINMRIALEEGLKRLAAKGRALSRSRSVDQTDVQPTSIRLKPATKHFLECQAEVLNTSLQSVIHMVLDCAAEAKANEVLTTLRVIHERFLFLLRVHKIDFPEAASILRQYGFTLSCFADENRLLDLLTEEVLRFLVDTFHVERGWLSGVQKYTTRARTWYKNTYKTAKTLLRYASDGLDPQVIFIRRRGAEFGEDNNQTYRQPEEIGFVVQLNRSTSNGVKFQTFETWAFEPWSYKNLQREAQALIAFCCSAQSAYRLCYVGYELPQASLEQLKNGQILPAEVLKSHCLVWHPEDHCGRSDKRAVDKLIELLQPPNLADET